MREYEITHVGDTIAYARTDERNTLLQCDKHDRLEAIPAAALTVTLNGTTLALQESAEVFYCPECVDTALRDFDRRDVDDLELLQEAIAEEWTNPHRRGQMHPELFRPVETDTDAADVLYCPYCADHVERAGDAVECSVHGRLAIDVAAFEEAPAR
jgi:hypothetical protein